MLSDEMHLIKQHFYDKDITTVASTKFLSEINAPTPTLQILQKWSVVELLNAPYEINSENQHSQDLKENDSNKQLKSNKVNRQEILTKNISSDKVIELRSLSHHLPSHESNRYEQNSQLCSCLESNMCTTCTHSTPDKNVNFCTHIEESSHMPFIYPTMYMSYQPIYWNSVTEIPYRLTYYRPEMLNDLNLSKKKKHRKTTSRNDQEYLYYDDSNRNKEKHMPKKIFSEYIAKNNDKEINDDIIINVEYDVESDKKINSGNDIRIHERPFGINKQRFVNNIVEDLNKLYRDSVIKKCYCSSSPMLRVLAFYTYFTVVCLLNYNLQYIMYHL